jgi:hypothetical protein
VADYLAALPSAVHEAVHQVESLGAGQGKNAAVAVVLLLDGRRPFLQNAGILLTMNA